MGSVNWADLQKAAGDAAFEPLPPDVYAVYVDTAEVKTSSNSNEYIKVKFKVADGPHKNRVVWNNFTLVMDNSTSLAFFFRHMAMLGLGPEFFATNPTMQQVAIALVSRPCRVKTGIKTYNEVDSAEVKNILPPEPGQAAGPSVPETSFGSMPAAPSVAAPPAPVVTPQAPAAAPQVPVAPTVPQPIETPF